MASFEECVRVEEMLHGALRALIPPPKLDLPTWIETNLVLPADVSATPGSVRLHPYQRGIAEAISNPEIERITLVKSVRIGLSTLLTATIANYVANQPAQIMLLLPTESDCRDYVVSDLEPIFSATPILRDALSADHEEAGRNTLLSRRFPGGGTLKIVAAKAPRNLRRHNIRILLADEIDGYDYNGPEGNPLQLATRRTLSYSNRVIIAGSTPTHEETSTVLRLYAESDQRIYEVPCPECGAFNQILFRHIEWPPGEPGLAQYRCPHCAALIPERFKPQMVATGQWRATASAPGHAGFKINALVSQLPNASWGRIAAEFLKSKDDPSQLMVWINTLMAEGYRETASRIDENELAARAEPFGLDRIPPEILIVTVGCDVQDDRLELIFLGHSRDEMFVLAHQVIWGSVLANDTWAELDDALKTIWTHPKGGTLRVDCAIIDSSDNTDIVYGFCKPRYGRRIFAGKGVAGSRPQVEASKTRQLGARLFILGVDNLKSEIVQRLARGRTIRFSDSLNPIFYEQLSSERLIVKYSRGMPVRQWEKLPGRRNECLDALCYAKAARNLVGVDLDRREVEVATVGTLPPLMPNVIRSAWLGGR